MEPRNLPLLQIPRPPTLPTGRQVADLHDNLSVIGRRLLVISYFSRGGEIGRRTCLRSKHRKVCRFKSCPRHIVLYFLVLGRFVWIDTHRHSGPLRRSPPAGGERATPSRNWFRKD